MAKKKTPEVPQPDPANPENVTVGDFAAGTEGQESTAPKAPAAETSAAGEGESAGSEEPDSSQQETPETAPEQETAPADESAPQEIYTPQKYDWPASSETRVLKVPLTPEDESELSHRIAGTIPEIARVQREAKSAASTYKSQLEELQNLQAEISDIILAGERDRSVPCTWVFECGGVAGDTGERIFSPDYKALFRDDTGAFIEATRITSSDRQMALTLPESPTEKKEEPDGQPGESQEPQQDDTEGEPEGPADSEEEIKF